MNNYYSIITTVIIIFILVFVIVSYILTALGMQAMAKKLQIENSWLAWIPIADAYLMGKIAGDQVIVFRKVFSKLRIVLLIGNIFVSVISLIPLIGLLVGIIYAVIYYIALYKIYRIFAEKNAVMYIVLSIVTGVLIAPFFIFFSSKHEPNLAIFNEGKPGGYREASVATQSVIPEPAPDTVQSETQSEVIVKESENRFNG